MSYRREETFPNYLYIWFTSKISYTLSCINHSFHSFIPFLISPVFYFPLSKASSFILSILFYMQKEKKPCSFPLPAGTNVFVLGKVQVYLSEMLPIAESVLQENTPFIPQPLQFMSKAETSLLRLCAELLIRAEWRSRSALSP